MNFSTFLLESLKQAEAERKDVEQHISGIEPNDKFVEMNKYELLATQIEKEIFWRRENLMKEIDVGNYPE